MPDIYDAADFERMDDATDHIVVARAAIAKATEQPDPVARRRQMATAASALRTAANRLDDNGRLQDD